MERFIIRTIHISNFRNIEDLTLDFNEGVNVVGGKNHIGKTNVLNAIHWLLTDKLLGNNSDITSIKPKGDLNAIVSVECAFIVVHEKTLATTHTIRKEYESVFNNENAYIGNKETYYFNNVKCDTKKEFDLKYYAALKITGLETKSKVDLIQLLINPFYLGELSDSDKWREVSKLLQDCGIDTTDEEVVKTDESFSLLVSDLMGNDYNDVRKLYNQTLKKQNETISELKGKIDLLKTLCLEVNESKVSELEKKLTQLDEKIYSLRNEMDESKYIGTIQDELNKAELRYSQTYNIELQEFNEKLGANQKNEFQFEINLLQNEIAKGNEEINRLQGEINALQVQIDTKLEADLVQQRKMIGEQYYAVKKQINELKDLKSCPYCRQTFATSKAGYHQSLLKVALDEKMQNIVNNGTEVSKKLTSLHEKQDKYVKEVKIKKDRVNELTNDISLKTERCKDLQNSLKNEPVQTFAPSENLLQLQKDIDDLENKKKSAHELFLLEYDKKQKELQDIVGIKNIVNTELQKISAAKLNADALKEAENQMKAIVSDKNTTEYKIALLQRFVNAKLKLLETKTSELFGFIKWRFIKENIKAGSWDEDCTPLIARDGQPVEFKNGSQSEKILTGVAILNVFKNKLNLPELPILIDEGAELDNNSLIYLKKQENQIVLVKVDDDSDIPTIKEN